MNHEDDPAIASDLYRQLSALRWQEQFDTKTLGRGLRYAEEDRVDPDWAVFTSPVGLALTGEVRGSGRTIYETQLVLLDSGNRGTLIGECSCPVGYRCKHIVALIQHFLHSMDFELNFAPGPVPKGRAADTQALEQEWNRWLTAVATPLHSTQEALEPDRRLGLFIDTEPGHPLARVVAGAAWLRPAKSKHAARLVDPKMIEWVGERLVPEPAGGWDPELLEQLMLLLQRASRRQNYATRSHLSTLVYPYHARILHALLAATDAPAIFHRKQTGPRLTLGPRRSLHTRWETDATGSRRLRAELDGQDRLSASAELAMVGDELWYLDPGQGLLGPVDGDPRLAASVSRSPPLPDDKLAWLAERMQRTAHLPTGLAPPAAMKIVELPAVAPTLLLRMDVRILEQEGWPPRSCELGVAHPEFGYHDISLAADDDNSEVIGSNGDRLQVKRDPQAEAALLANLPAELLRFDTLVGRAGLPPPREDAQFRLLVLSASPPDSRAAWPTSLASPQQWWPTLVRLRRAGVRVQLEPDFPPEPQRLTADDWHGELEASGQGWFDLGLDIDVAGKRLNLLPILRSLLADARFPLTPAADEAETATWEVLLDDDCLLELPLARLRSLLAPIIDWLGDAPDADVVRMPVTAAAELDAIKQRWTGRGRKQVRELARALRSTPNAIHQAPGFEGHLRDYQARGVAWLRWLSLLGLGGLLADDMGLGKTVQVLAHIMDERARNETMAPVMVVATTSLVSNWCAEAARFCPELRVLHLQRPRLERKAILSQLGEADLIITTYPLLVRDLDVLRAQSFSLLVLDEAQFIKNAASHTAKAVRAIPAARRIAMTGTPIENHLGELWAQFDAVAPGFLGSSKWFGQHFRRPIERHGESEPLQQLQRRIQPLLLRRTRDEVLGELPAKTETLRSVVITGVQRDLYETLRLAQHQRVRQSIEQRGLARSGIVMLDALLKLRQVCCDPRLVKLDSARSVKRSAKLVELRSLLATLLEEGRRVLLFSQFTEMLDLIADDLTHDGIPFLTLTGQVPGAERKQRIDRFQNGEVPLFLISLKAGGSGLNLTAADTVIHYDPWWNPAVEEQATGRAHRMGQSKPVLVYKLVCAGTVEERITAMQRSKSELAASILSQGAERSGGSIMDEDELEALFAPMDTS